MRQVYLSRNVADYVELPQHRAPEIKPLDFAQSIVLLETLAAHRLIALYRLALNLGMRQSELTGLTWNCIDFKAKTITVRQQLQRHEGSWKLETTKTKAGERLLVIDDDLVDVLVEHRRNQDEERLLLGAEFRDPFRERGGLVFTSETGAPLHGSMVIDPYKQALKRAGLPNIRFHDLRHTAATLMLADKVPLVTVSKVLGHSSPAITAEIYAHALDESKARAIAGLSARLRKK